MNPEVEKAIDSETMQGLIPDLYPENASEDIKNDRRFAVNSLEEFLNNDEIKKAVLKAIKPFLVKRELLIEDGKIVKFVSSSVAPELDGYLRATVKLTVDSVKFSHW